MRRTGAWPAAKRLADVLGALVGLVALMPLMALLAMAITATSKGGPIFVQPRVGRDEQWFRLIKLRTMVVDAAALQESIEHLNELDGAVFGIRDDPRVTPIGRVLRRFSLDELPQLLNVLKGDMSLVGPRPLPERDFELLPPEARMRFRVKPGMTGLAQVAGRNELPFEQMVALDGRYVRECSPRLDLSILIRTPGAVLRARGAY